MVALTCLNSTIVRFLVLLFVCGCVYTDVDKTVNWHRNLIDRLVLLSKNNSNLVPPVKTLKSIKVYYSLYIYQLGSYDEKQNYLQATVYLTAGWKNEILKWRKVEYGNIASEFLPTTLIWLPDVAIFPVLEESVSLIGEDAAEIDSNGNTRFTRILNIRIPCIHKDYYEFPFDKADCSFTIGSWTMGKDSLDLKRVNAMWRTRKSDQWKILDITKKRVFRTYKNFTDFDFTISIQRLGCHLTSYAIKIATMFGIAVPFILLLPAVRTERILLGIVNAVALILLMNEYLDEVEFMAALELPRVMSYFIAIIGFNFSVMVWSICENIIWFQAKDTTYMPIILETIIFDYVGKIVLAPTIPAQSISIEAKPSQDQTTVDIHSNNSYHADKINRWQLLLIIFDRFMFVLGILIVAILCGSYLSKGYT